jgi:FkbM family methyltransferase
LNEKLSTLLRTAQTSVPRLQPFKENSQAAWRAILRQPHERDFRALRLLKHAPSALVLDVGANRGQSIRSVRLYWPDAQVLAVEPNPALADRLQQRAGSSVRVFRGALGKEATSLVLYVPEYNGWVFDGLASLVREEAAGWLQHRILGFRHSRMIIHEIPVDVVRLDDVGDSLAPRLIKIDTQGTENDVLEGGRQLLARCHPILLIESGRFQGRLREILEPLGYQPYVFHQGRLVPGDTGALNTYFIAGSLAEATR